MQRVLMKIEAGADIQRRPGGIVSEGIWRVLACPMRTLRIRISSD